MRGQFKILPAKFMRDARLERSIVEYNRERVFVAMVLVGGALVILAVIY